MVRGKFQLQEITQIAWGGDDARKLVFRASYDPSIPEDQGFSEATPDGKIEMYVDNPAALAQLELKRFYYVDFTPAEE